MVVEKQPNYRRSLTDVFVIKSAVMRQKYSVGLSTVADNLSAYQEKKSMQKDDGLVSLSGCASKLAMKRDKGLPPTQQ
jgi:hypothetical protein